MTHMGTASRLLIVATVGLLGLSACTSEGGHAVHPVSSARMASFTVPLAAAPAIGGLKDAYTIRWAAHPPARGQVYDVQEEAPGSHVFRRWKTATRATEAVFKSGNAGGGFRFRARLRDVSSGTVSPWSKPRSVTVVPIDKVVVIIKENRTFDHMFGRFPGADGARFGYYLDGTRVPLTSCAGSNAPRSRAQFLRRAGVGEWREDERFLQGHRRRRTLHSVPSQ